MQSVPEDSRLTGPVPHGGQCRPLRGRAQLPTMLSVGSPWETGVLFRTAVLWFMRFSLCVWVCACECVFLRVSFLFERRGVRVMNWRVFTRA